MRFSRRRFMTISAAAGASALLSGRVFAGTGTVRWSGVAMGASVSLSIAGITPGRAEKLIGDMRAEIERLEAIFSLYRADSAIMRLNRAGVLEAPPFDLLTLLSTANAIHESTGGAFDPTVQPVWALLAETGGKPGTAAVERVRSLVGWPGVHVGADRISFAKPGMAITLNGIAQGYATDRVASLLKAAGLDNVLVSIGEIAALGRLSAHEPWRVGIAEHGDGPPEERITLENAAIATTAPMGTVLDAHGKIGHVVDPRADHAGVTWRRVSVIHGSAAIADGLSTGFALLSAAQIADSLKRFPGSEVKAVAADGSRLQHTS